MRNRGRVAIAAAAAVAVGLAGAVASHAAGAVGGLLKVRLGGDSQQTRLVMDIDQAASARLVADGADDGHVVLVLPTISAAGGLQGLGQGLVKAWSVDQTSGGARLQLDLAPDARIKGRFLLPPADGVDHYRYVVDVIYQPGQVRMTSAKVSAIPVALKLRPQIIPTITHAAPISLKKVIVIDPGHGGHDPGASGAQGFEKDVNLAAAMALKERLERSTRYQVVLTRNDDTYVPLQDRVRIAQRAGADLFISLHSDSGGDASVRGASVYTLSDKASNRAARFVKQDDWFMKASLTGDRGVQDILFDLTQRNTKNRSAAFANTLVSHIDGKTPLLRRSQRDAGFMVLLAPDVPAVLLEMGFVTNAEDEEFLRDPAQRKRLMSSVGDAIDDYFAEATRLASR
ncbi:N-acetylmuramoyl-L-alanine amidase [Phenylobacterium sp.]|jgi:N-acetylmuramoyl-L-alanine amidase|uniref:N-acetylmuramoyl-L-alanine amidase family protein n=1 Tax=Phenylobacterium sp. TaxID=1871053 RepID=UPI002E34FDAF|nr:N-acetylmuramoyl-L-alanine amidase [Phenylobacterium sp.]HEX3366574.1 N-acetylmuramoyl-L-alanine amidase [Phenylobacterium sp.]